MVKSDLPQLVKQAVADGMLKATILEQTPNPEGDYLLLTVVVSINRQTFDQIADSIENENATPLVKRNGVKHVPRFK